MFLSFVRENFLLVAAESLLFLHQLNILMIGTKAEI